MRILRVGLFFNIIYFVVIILLKDKLLNFAWLIGIIYGIEEGVYHSAYNLIDSSVVKADNRAYFTGMVSIFTSIFKIALPILIGYILTVASYDILSILTVVLIALTILISLKIKFELTTQYSKCEMRTFSTKLKDSNYKNVKYVLTTRILDGFITNNAALGVIMSVFLVEMMPDSSVLGTYSSLFALFAVIAGFLFAKLIVNPKHYKQWSLICGVLYIISIGLFLLFKDIYTLVFYNIVNSFCLTIFKSINTKLDMDTSNCSQVGDKFKTEYFVSREFYLLLGRTAGYAIMIVLGLFYSTTILFVSISIFLIMTIAYIIRTIKILKNNNMNFENECTNEMKN